MNRQNIIRILCITAIALAILYILFQFLSAGNIVVSENWVKKFGFGEEPVDIAASQNSLYTVSSASEDKIIIRKLSSDGIVQWELPWSPPGEGKVYPITIRHSGNYVVVSAFAGARNNIYILYLRDNGIIDKVYKPNISFTTLIFDVEVYGDGSVILGGLTYNEKLKTQAYISRINPLINYTHWTITWGLKGYDYVVDLAVSEKGYIYALVNSTLQGSVLLYIDETGKIIRFTPLGPLDPVTLTVSQSDDSVFVLTKDFMSHNYKLFKASAMGSLQGKTINKPEPLLGNISFTDILVFQDNNLAALSGYIKSNNSINAVIILYHTDNVEPDKLIRLTGRENSMFIKLVFNGYELSALGLTESGIVVASYTIKISSPNIYGIIICSISVGIAILLLYLSWRKRSV
ncbi:hypothetical protein [Staphylothermus hellenicus]|uniref:Uncharacterized protein n=1 Tax=Staphylothermus hellenicus (strain DSM 12710 / JCM 10830 / BK20S6-10-b1 / P8) TaxID=591019 RepID=D7D9A0_STAHD|nr:hypothetical protein [Staphylothermus hellenicus]ADI32346.1 hypothetical protein Shell_1248 [Staphylothermus hellenicus DSM 12710]